MVSALVLKLSLVFNTWFLLWLWTGDEQTAVGCTKALLDHTGKKPSSSAQVQASFEVTNPQSTKDIEVVPSEILTFICIPSHARRNNEFVFHWSFALLSLFFQA